MEFVLGTAGTGPTFRPAVYSVSNTETDISGAGTAVTGTKTQKFISYPNNVLGFDQNRIAGSSHNHKPRCTWTINRIYAKNNATGAIQAVALATDEVYVEFDVCELLLLSPFAFCTPDGKQGMYGISNLTFQFNMASNANRAWRAVRFNQTANFSLAGKFKEATIDKFENSQFILCSSLLIRL
jgi:hypothetical protein